MCAAFTLDIFCLIFVPLHWLFFVASTYVLFNYIWHTGESVNYWLFCTVYTNTCFFSELLKNCWSFLHVWSFPLFVQRKVFVYRQRPCGFCLCTRRLHFASKTWKPLTPTFLIFLLRTGALILHVSLSHEESEHFPYLKQDLTIIVLEAISKITKKQLLQGFSSTLLALKIWKWNLKATLCSFST